jgi:hypothetical protein
VDPVTQDLAAQLAASAVRNSAAIIADRIRAIGARKRDAEAVAELEEIVNDLLADKAEVTRIAQAYQEQLVAQRITDDEVRYIAETIVPLLKELVATTDAADQEIEKYMPALEALVSVQTVTVLQLFGFNFKRAIGEPLTEVVSRLIEGAAPPSGDVASELALAQARQQTAMMEVASDPDAFNRLQEMLGRR